MREVIFFTPEGAKFAIGRYSVEYFPSSREALISDSITESEERRDCPTLMKFWEILDEVEALPQKITAMEYLERLRKESARQVSQVRKEINRPYRGEKPKNLKKNKKWHNKFSK